MRNEELAVYGSAEAAQQLGINIKNLQVWLQRHPDHRPAKRVNTDDMLWTPADIERVRQARQAKAKYGNRHKVG